MRAALLVGLALLFLVASCGDDSDAPAPDGTGSFDAAFPDAPAGGWADESEVCATFVDGGPEPRPCRPDLVCCYPCGIPDCNSICQAPCTGAGCSGGCPLVP